MLLSEKLQIAGEAAAVYPPGHGYDCGCVEGRWTSADILDDIRVGQDAFG
jgi:hypothetical protein